MRKYLDIIKEQETNYTVGPDHTISTDANTAGQISPRDYRNKRLVKLVQKKNELLDMLDEVNAEIDDIIARNQNTS